MIIKKFESFNNDLFEESNYDWYLSHKRVGMSDDEYYKLKDYFSKLRSIQFLPMLPPTKHNYDPSSFFQITNKFTSFCKAEVMKMDDEWWFVTYSRELDREFLFYKCDTMDGVFQLFNKIKPKILSP